MADPLYAFAEDSSMCIGIFIVKCILDFYPSWTNRVSLDYDKRIHRSDRITP